MKSLYIKATAAVLMCAFALTGCSAGKIDRVQKAERIAKAQGTAAETGTGSSNPVQVETPAKGGAKVDGGLIYYWWSKVDGVDGYEVGYFFDGTTAYKEVTVQAPTNYIVLKLEEGREFKFKVRSFKTVSGKKYYSEWGYLVVDNPSYDPVGEYEFLDACIMDLERLESFARVKNYKFNPQKDNDKILAEIRIKDKDQQGFWHTAKRVGKDVAEAAAEGYYESVKENYKKIPISNGVEEYIDKLDKEAKENAKKKMTKKAVSSMLKNTDICCIYQYGNTNIAPEVCKIAILKANHKGLPQYFSENFAECKKQDGSYFFLRKGTNQTFRMILTQTDHYWILTLYPTHPNNE